MIRGLEGNVINGRAKIYFGVVRLKPFRAKRGLAIIQLAGPPTTALQQNIFSLDYGMQVDIM